MNRLVMIALSFVALVLKACVPSCPESGGEVRIYDEDFERLCEGAPCGWTFPATTTTATAETITTIHPGETGLRLSGPGVVIESNGAANRGPNGSISFPLQARVSARCDEGASLVVRFVTEKPDTRESTGYTASVALPSEWSAPTMVTLARDDRRGESFESLGRSVTFASIEKLGSGVCEIDRLEVVDMSFAGGFCD